ncbi:MAG TPA: efflux RND transporter periplasmic adaptor subunit [Spongiibacteraceae bacterium]|jgi:RND family efflux transporter MFP subunit
MSATTSIPKRESASEVDISQLRIRHAPQAPQQKKSNRKIWIIATTIVIGAIASWLIYPHAFTVQTTAVTMVYPSQQYVLLNATGYVVPQLKAAVASKATGRLEWLGVVEGAHVKKGQVLARLESNDVQAIYENAMANVNVARAGVETAYAEMKNAEKTLQRMNEMHSKGFMSQAAVDDAVARARKANAGVTSARAALEAAEATANNAEVSVDYTEIRAPFDGVILSKAANIGDIVTPMSSAADAKGAVVTMADMSTLEVEADVSESNLAQIKVDQPCVITLDSIANQQFRGVVSRIVPTIDRSKATVATKVRFIDLDSRILPDMSAKVSFLSQTIAANQQRPLLAVNPQAVAERNGKHVVFVLQKDKVAAVEVAVGHSLGDVVGIKGAVKAGDPVVLNPPGRLDDGNAIIIAKPL